MRNQITPAAIIGYSGALILPDDSPDAIRSAVRARPPVLLAHGEADDLIPAQAMIVAAGGLAALEIPVEWHLSQGIGHGIDNEGLRHGGEFLARRVRA